MEVPSENCENNRTLMNTKKNCGQSYREFWNCTVMSDISTTLLGVIELENTNKILDHDIWSDDVEAACFGEPISL